jgi:hypothetical protein
MPEQAKPVQLVGHEAYSELFDAAQVVLDWMRDDLRPYERPVDKFNRLSDAIDRVREAHQMHGFRFEEPPHA